jgi:signal transduction histidine kinase
MSGYAPVYAGGLVVAAVGVDIGAGFMGAIQLFRRSILIFAGLAVVLTVVVALVLAGTLTRPIQRLVTAAREIGSGNLAQAVDTSARDELGYLAETMEEMRRRLLARDAQLRQMLAGVAHEIRNPLGGIQIYAGLIADDLPAADPRKQHIQKVIEEVRNLNRVITEFLEFARPAPPSPEWTPVTRLVEDAAFLLGPEMEEAGVVLRQEVPAELRAFADAEQVKRALVNLMKNGVQAMRQGGCLRVWAGAVDGQVVVEVADTGAGMDPQVQQRLFEPFFTTREKGSGLGLAIVRRSLEENGGRVELKRTGADGTVFQMVLPGRPWPGERESV